MTFPVCALQVSCCHELCVYPELILLVDGKGTWVSDRVLPGWGWGEGAGVLAGRLTRGRFSLGLRIWNVCLSVFCWLSL